MKIEADIYINPLHIVKVVPETMADGSERVVIHFVDRTQYIMSEGIPLDATMNRIQGRKG